MSAETPITEEGEKSWQKQDICGFWRASNAALRVLGCVLPASGDRVSIPFSSNWEPGGLGKFQDRLERGGG